jgi:hypothetical protein
MSTNKCLVIIQFFLKLLKSNFKVFFYYSSVLVYLNSPFALATTENPDTVVWHITQAQVSSEIRVESTQKNGEELQLVYLPDGHFIEIPVDLNSNEITKSGLNKNQVAEAREESRQIVELTLRGLESDDLNTAIALDATNEALTLKPAATSSEKKSLNIFKKLFVYNNQVYSPAPDNLSAPLKLKRFVQILWQFVFVETIHASANYYKEFKAVAPRFTEFGIALDLKVEPQIFIAKFNPTEKVKILSRSYAIFFEIAYSRTEKRLMIRSRLRKEKGAGGLGLPSLKGEFKIFQADGTKTAYRGKSWYPVSPPIASFVLDYSQHYFAQGITIGVNSGDLIPGSTLTNTFTDFVQSETRFRIEDIQQKSINAVNRVKKNMHPSSEQRVKMCSQLFYYTL